MCQEMAASSSLVVRCCECELFLKLCIGPSIGNQMREQVFVACSIEVSVLASFCLLESSSNLICADLWCPGCLLQSFGKLGLAVLLAWGR